MLSKRLLFLFGLVFFLTTGIVYGIRYRMQNHLYYNCLILNGQDQLQLNRHAHLPKFEISTSPDDNYRLFAWPRPDTPMLVVEDIHSREWHFIKDWFSVEQRYGHPPGTIHRYRDIEWSTNNEFIYITEDIGDVSFQGFVNLDNGQTLATWAQIVKFSATDDYVYMWQYEPLMFSTYDFEPVDISYLPEVVNSRSVWSPTSSQLAYIAEESRSLVIFYPDQSRYEAYMLPDLDMLQTTRRYRHTIEWSPDGKHLAVTEKRVNSANYSGIYVNHVFAIRDSGAVLVAQFESNVFLSEEEWDENDSSSLFPRHLFGRFTSPDEYITFQLPPETGEERNQSTYRFDMWRFDLAEQQQELIAFGIKAFNSSGSKLALLREIETGLLLEISNKDGRNPIVLQTFPKESRPVCSWGVHRRELEHFLGCHDTISRNGWLFDEYGTTIWPPDETTGAAIRFFTNPAHIMWDSPNDQFVIIPQISIDDSVITQLLDTQTGQTYQLSPGLVAQWTPYLPRYYSNGRSFEMFPWPDDENSWAVQFDANYGYAPVVYRFTPDGNLWELAPFTSPDIWSPDRKRFAYVRDNDTPYAADLFVQESDGSRQWHLGSFPYATLMDIEWEQCGNLMTPLRDYLAADAP